MKHKNLDLLLPYIGRWKTDGKTRDGEILSGTDCYEWVEGGFFMVHRVEVNLGEKRIAALEIIHYDEMDDVFRAQSYGNDGAITISTLKIIDDIILIFSDQQRFQGHFKKDCIEGKWEVFESGEWKLWMDIKLTRIK